MLMDLILRSKCPKKKKKEVNVSFSAVMGKLKEMVLVLSL